MTRSPATAGTRSKPASARPPRPLPVVGTNARELVPGLSIALALALLTLIAYAPVVGNQFFEVLDDDMYVTHNPAVLSGLSTDGLKWAVTTLYANNWHPLTWISLQIDASLYGDCPWGYHFTNLCLHVANTLLLFGVLWELTGARWAGAAVAALFAVHPLHVESVAWVAERKDVLSTLFWMITLWAYARYARAPSPRRYLAVVAAFGLGLAAKPMLVTLPCVLLLLDYWPLRRWGSTPGATPVRKLVAEKIPLLALAVACSYATLAAQHWIVQALDRYPVGVRLSNALVSYVAYLRQTVWPAGLAFYYSHPRDSLPVWQVVAAAALLVAVTALAMAHARRRPYLPVGWLWYLGTLVPVIGIIQVGGQGMADRYTYVPLIGVFIAVVWLAADWAGRREPRRIAVAVVAVAVLVACTGATRAQISYWATGERMLEHALAVTHDNYRVDITLAAGLLEHGKVAEARKHLDLAMRLAPDEPLVHVYLGMAAAREGRLEETARCYHEALRLRPGDSEVLDKLGRVYVRLGRYDEAFARFEEALQRNPDNGQANLDFGMALGARGRQAEAIERFREACRLLPGAFEPHADLALALVQAGRRDEARAEFLAAARLNPGRVDQMARSLITHSEPAQRDGHLAVLIADAVCEATGRAQAAPLDTLASAQAEAGDFQTAAVTARAALAIAPPNSELARQIGERLRLYKAGQRPGTRP